MRLEGERMPKQKVLFICVHNSARSQMAAAMMNHTCGEFFATESAGLEPGIINPLVIEVLQEVGIDISKNKTQRVFRCLEIRSDFPIRHHRLQRSRSRKVSNLALAASTILRILFPENARLA